MKRNFVVLAAILVVCLTSVPPAAAQHGGGHSGHSAKSSSKSSKSKSKGSVTKAEKAERKAAAKAAKAEKKRLDREAKATQRTERELRQGYYRDVDGHKVHVPVFSSTRPKKATCQCADGAWSFSHHTQGACSGHGGIK